MRRKAAQIKDRIRARAQKRIPPRIQEMQRSSKPGYKVIAISVYSDQAESVERTAQELLEAGFPKATRSFVIQTAIQRLHEDLEGKTGEEMAKYFLERQTKRPLARAGSRRQEPKRPTGEAAHPNQQLGGGA